MNKTKTLLSTCIVVTTLLISNLPWLNCNAAPARQSLSNKNKHHEQKHNKTANQNTNTKDVNNVNLASSIKHIIDKYGDGVNIGITVQSLNNGNIIYQRNANQLYSPASSLKVFTAASALSYLGPNFTFKTRVLATPHSISSQGVLNSDVYFYFDGDPTLTRSDLNELVSVLKKIGINTINGNVYLDDSALGPIEFGPGWMWDERNFCYAAPVSAINIDHNCFPITVSAAKTNGTPIKIIQQPGYSFLNFVNNAITSDIAHPDYPLTLHGTEKNTYVFSGYMKSGTGPWELSVAVRDLRTYAAAVITQVLRQNNIKLNGTITFTKIPATKQLAVIASHDSAPLSKLVKIMLKKSDNLIADAIYKRLGFAYTGNPGTWINGAKAISNVIGKNAGINFGKIKIVDGCGLSRHNLLSPQSLVALMNYVYHNNAIRDTFIAALPIAGYDGHLQGRMATIKKQVRAKTGTMKSVTALTGYIYTNKKQILSFAIMINDFTERVHKYQRLEDEICTLLAKNL